MTGAGSGEEEVCASGGSEDSRDAELRNSACAGAAEARRSPNMSALRRRIPRLDDSRPDCH